MRDGGPQESAGYRRRASSSDAGGGPRHGRRPIRAGLLAEVLVPTHQPALSPARGQVRRPIPGCRRVIPMATRGWRRAPIPTPIRGWGGGLAR